MRDNSKWLLVVPICVMFSTIYVACSSDGGDPYSPSYKNAEDASPDTVDGNYSNWPDSNIEDSPSDANDEDELDAPFSGTG